MGASSRPSAARLWTRLSTKRGLALVRLRNGLATQVEMLDAELAMTTASAQLVQALYACNIARAQLELVTGIYGYSEKEISGEGE